MTQLKLLRATQEFFGPRAAGWEERFPNDSPQYARAVADLDPPLGATALDLGCGTGRALPPLRNFVGPAGRVIGFDATAEMLLEARTLGRDRIAELIFSDAMHLPLPTAYVDIVFAGGLLPHLADTAAALREFARVTRPGGKLAVFHPVGRKTLAARHNQVPSDDDIIAPVRLSQLCVITGWHVGWIDDAEDRYLMLATRC
ncbi:MAG: class I SAM-dependent methyltransferase [Anaerolineae bacterium]